MRFTTLRAGIALRATPLVVFFAIAVGSVAAAESATSPAGRADLAVAASDALDPSLVDRKLTFRVTVSNVGPQAAERVKLTVSIAGRAEPVARPSVSVGSCLGQSATQARCTLNTIRSKRRAFVSVRVQPTEVGTLAVTAVVTSPTPDAKRRNNRTTQTTRVVGMHSVQGRGIRSTRGDAGYPVVTTEIDARRDPTAGGSVTGSFVLQYAPISASPARGSDLRGRIVCLSVEANRAMAAGVVETSNNAAYPSGTVVRMAFTDNGEPAATPDMAVAFIGGEPSCALEVVDELPLLEGNYVVRDGEP